MPNCISPSFQWNMQEVPSLAWKTTTLSPAIYGGAQCAAKQVQTKATLVVKDYNSYKLGH